MNPNFLNFQCRATPTPSLSAVTPPASVYPPPPSPSAGTAMPPSLIGSRTTCEPTPITNRGRRPGRDQGRVPVPARFWLDS